MHYFAKLVLGGFYKYKGQTFVRGEEQIVTEDVYNYLSKLYDGKVIGQGSARELIKAPLFEVRAVEPPQEERVLEEVKDAPDSLRPVRKRKEAE